MRLLPALPETGELALALLPADARGVREFAKAFFAGADVPALQAMAEQLRATPMAPSPPGSSLEARLTPFVSAVQRLAATGPAWLAPAAANRDVAEIAALLLYRRTMLGRLNPSPLRALFENNISWKNVARMRSIALESDYGVDEWVQHIIMHHALEANAYFWLRSSTPAAGVYSIEYDPMVKKPPLEGAAIVTVPELPDSAVEPNMPLMLPLK